MVGNQASLDKGQQMNKTAAALLSAVNAAAATAKADPSPENCEAFVTVKRDFNTATRAMKYHALEISVARGMLSNALTRYDAPVLNWTEIDTSVGS